MDQTYVALKLLLDELNLQGSIKTVSDRKTVQKAVYLGQAAGVDLGYRYNWYHMGPYSPGLTRDYFSLAEALEAGESTAGFELQESARDRLARAKSLLTVPAGVDLQQADWLELLASTHFLRTQRRLTAQQAKELLNKEKRHVSPFADHAARALENVGLIAA